MPKKLPSGAKDGAIIQARSQTALDKRDSPKHPKKQAKKHEDHHHLHKDLERAYCHLGRASTIGFELDAAPREFVAHFLDYGCELYLNALSEKGKRAERSAFAAAEVLRAAEHIAAAGLYGQNRKAVPKIPPPKTDTGKQTKDIRRKIDDAVLDAKSNPHLVRFTAAAREMLSHAQQAADAHETQLAHEFMRAADALAEALPQLPE